MFFFVQNLPFQTRSNLSSLFFFRENGATQKFFPQTKETKKLSEKKFYSKTKNIRKQPWVAVFGPGGGFLGVGTSELVVIGVVAWLVLGPKRLYQLARDIGKISGEIKNVADEARQTFQQAIDVESGELTGLSSKKNSPTQTLPENNDKLRLNDIDDLVNEEISTLEKKKKKD